MGPIKRIKQRTRGARPIKFRQALQHYARDGIDVSAGLRATPEVYAALAERALYWTGELWSGLQQAAERREALRPAAASVLELVADYFEQPERWPTVDRELWEPPRLCVPACFALSVAQHFVGSTQPALARFGAEQPLAFYRELLGPAVAEALARAAKERITALWPLLRSAGDAPRDTPVLDFSEPPVFDAGLRALWRQALAAAASAAPSPVTPPPTSPPAQPPGALAAWHARLAGARMHGGLDSLRDSDYSGGGYFSTRERTIELRSGGAFLWRETSHLRVSAGGLNGTTTSHDDRHGAWKLTLLRQEPLLELHGSDGWIGVYRLADGGPGTVMLDGLAYALSR